MRSLLGKSFYGFLFAGVLALTPPAAVTAQEGVGPDEASEAAQQEPATQSEPDLHAEPANQSEPDVHAEPANQVESGQQVEADQRSEPAETAEAPLEVAEPKTDGAPAPKRLYTIPEDGERKADQLGPNGRLVRALLEARPNEDIVICVAGCFTGHDRVVYAQPAEPRPVKAKAPVAATKPATTDAKVSQMPEAAPAEMKKAEHPATDPNAPKIVNQNAASIPPAASNNKLEPTMGSPDKPADGAEAKPAADPNAEPAK